MGEFDRYMNGIVTPDGIIEGESEQSSSGINPTPAALAIFDTVVGTTVE